MEAADPLPPGTRLQFRLQADRRTIEVEGWVVWTEDVIPPGSVIPHGVAFVTVASDWLPTVRALLLSEGKVRCTGLRLSLELSVTCRQQGEMGPPLQGWTGDISRGGLSLFLPQALSAGASLELILHTPGEPVALEGTIVWVAPPAKRAPGELIGHGLRIFPLDGSVSAPLERLLKELP